MENIKSFLKVAGCGILCFLWLIGLVCNIACPIQAGHPEYAVFNVIVCGLAAPTVWKLIQIIRSEVNGK